MKIENLPENPTRGVVRRTLRGMDGRIAHIETLASRWETRRIEETAAAAAKAALAPVLAEIEALSARVRSLEINAAMNATAAV